MPTPIDQIRQTNVGESVRLGDLTLFRIGKARFRYGQSYALLRDDATVLVDAVHAATRAAVDAVLAEGRPAGRAAPHPQRPAGPSLGRPRRAGGLARAARS